MTLGRHPLLAKLRRRPQSQASMQDQLYELAGVLSGDEEAFVLALARGHGPSPALDRAAIEGLRSVADVLGLYDASDLLGRHRG